MQVNTSGRRSASYIEWQGGVFVRRPVTIFVADGTVLYTQICGEARTTVDDDAQAKALRLRMYVFCSECARPIDLAEGNRSQRDVEGRDLLR